MFPLEGTCTCTLHLNAPHTFTNTVNVARLIWLVLCLILISAFRFLIFFRTNVFC